VNEFAVGPSHTQTKSTSPAASRAEAEPDAAASRRSRAGRHAVIMGSHSQKHEHRTSSSRSKRQRILIQQEEDDELAAGSSYRRRKDTERRRTHPIHTQQSTRRREP
jgi:hypothetical protein